MRFEQLSLERYGAFTDRRLEFRSGALVHVVHGRNEAGKTSALSAICDFLFGFGHLTPYDFEHDPKALRIGATLRLEDGATFAARRRKGRDNTLVDAQDRPLPEGTLARLLGAVNRQTFVTEFGLTAQALREGGRELMRAGGKLAETLAASSAGLQALSRLRGAVEQEADALFATRRVATKDFYKAADRHEAADRKLREAIVTVDAWKNANREVAAAAEAHAKLQDEFASLSADLERHQRAHRTRPRLVAMRRLREELAAFEGLAEVPGSTIAGWQAALEETSHVAQQLAELEAADRLGGARIAALAIDAAVLAAAPRINALRERLGAVAKAREDLPRRLEARRAAQDLIGAAARRLGLASSDMLLERLPTDPALARIRELIAEARRAGERLAEAEARLEAAAADVERLADPPCEGVALGNPAPLKRRLASFADVPLDADRLRRDRAAFERAHRRLAEEARGLDPPADPLDRFAALPLPTAEAIAAAVRSGEARAAELRQLAAELHAAEEHIAQAERALARLASAGMVSTRTDLAAMRERRNLALSALREAIEAPIHAVSERVARLDSLCTASLAVDQVTDRLLNDAERAARREALEDKRAEAIERQGGLLRQRQRLAAETEEGQLRWLDLWRASAITPLDPPRMARWRERLMELKHARHMLEEQETALAALSQKLDGFRPALTELARDLGLTAPAHQPIELLYRETASAVDTSEATWTLARERAVAREAAIKLMNSAEKALGKAGAADRAWRDIWPGAVAAVGLLPTASLAEAAAAIEIWQGVPGPKTTFERESRSIDGIHRYLEDFATEVGELTQDLAPDLKGRAPAEALAVLVQRLTSAGRAHEEKLHLSAAAQERDLKRQPLLHRQHDASRLLAEARERLGLSVEADLGAAVARLTQREALRKRLADLAADLASEARSEEELWSEQADINAATLDASIDELKRQRAALVTQEIGNARARLGEAEALLAALGAGRDAEGAATAKAEAATELLDIAERWLVRAAAGKLAALAIERHRAAVQDPLIARASALFALVTGGAFAGLDTEYDDKDQPVLVARRPSGGKVALEGLSEGTSDQLFLVLRLALLERRTIEPLPFIGDDLLASFDEARTGEALTALAAFGRSRQVILFTHHAHVAELARARLGTDADILPL